MCWVFIRHFNNIGMVTYLCFTDRDGKLVSGVGVSIDWELRPQPQIPSLDMGFAPRGQPGVAAKQIAAGPEVIHRRQRLLQGLWPHRHGAVFSGNRSPCREWKSPADQRWRASFPRRSVNTPVFAISWTLEERDTLTDIAVPFVSHRTVAHGKGNRN
jgi:hypothetical protein